MIIIIWDCDTISSLFYHIRNKASLVICCLCCQSPLGIEFCVCSHWHSKPMENLSLSHMLACVYMYIYVWSTHLCMCVEDIEYLLSCSPPYFLKSGLSLTQKLTNADRVAGQHGSWILLAPLPLLALGYRSSWPAFYIGARDTDSEPNTYTASTLSTEPSSQFLTVKKLGLRGLWELVVGHSTNKLTGFETSLRSKVWHSIQL